jgi:hypothetical protein
MAVSFIIDTIKFTPKCDAFQIYFEKVEIHKIEDSPGLRHHFETEVGQKAPTINYRQSVV